MSDTEWVDGLPNGSVVAAYDPEAHRPGQAPGLAWMWRKDRGEWFHAMSGGFHGTAYMASHPNLTIVYVGPRPRVGTLDLATLEELDTHSRQAMEAVEQ